MKKPSWLPETEDPYELAMAALDFIAWGSPCSVYGDSNCGLDGCGCAGEAADQAHKYIKALHDA